MCKAVYELEIESKIEDSVDVDQKTFWYRLNSSRVVLVSTIWRGHGAVRASDVITSSSPEDTYSDKFSNVVYTSD